VGTIQKIYC